MRVANFLQELQKGIFRTRQPAPQTHELQGHSILLWIDGMPDFAGAASAHFPNQAIPRNRFGAHLQANAGGMLLSRVARWFGLCHRVAPFAPSFASRFLL